MVEVEVKHDSNVKLTRKLVDSETRRLEGVIRTCLVDDIYRWL